MRSRKRHILIVEDDMDTSDMLCAYFEGQGYEVTTAAWGNDALQLCQEIVPDLIIQDIRLPDINGYEVVKQLRHSGRTQQVPVIFLTEMRDRADRIAGLKLGAVDYITKPFDMQELRLRVRNALRRASYESLVSPVTGLPGERVVLEKLEQFLTGTASPYKSMEGESMESIVDEEEMILEEIRKDREEPVPEISGMEPEVSGTEPEDEPLQVTKENPEGFFKGAEDIERAIIYSEILKRKYE